MIFSFVHFPTKVWPDKSQIQYIQFSLIKCNLMPAFSTSKELLALFQEVTAGLPTVIWSFILKQHIINMMHVR